MEERTISLIQSSLDGLGPISQNVENLFHKRLIDSYPEVYRLFFMDIEPEDRRLVHLLGYISSHMRHTGAIAATVRILAQSNKVFRLIEMHYEALAETLIWTLRRSLNDSFTIEVERAWMGALWGTSRVRTMVVA
ncbi:hypothetical protein KYK29_10635 [Shinella daejeonensis]|uniref:Globin family profile domain-containing protein n=1 Tax=Paradevosia shaoguanensis TaxID=1335043 RepID=A0AA41QMD6_9HYPH|nr:MULTISPECIES: hypothetical protein [Hyphomicrobiales]MCF1743054.1 hypothetical protein [Paradevosia shaoguanensis]MCI0127537.1 hypothetical protein [Paradevosia shaoguanensis]MCP8895388.1 hypothetical protein [Shinella daejeonensis]